MPAHLSVPMPGEALPITEPWVSVERVAAHLGVGKMSIYRWIEHRGLPAQKIGKLWKFQLSEVDRWMRDQGAHPKPATARREASPVAASRRRGPAKAVLVVDDDEAVRETLKEFLSDEGYDTFEAVDGETALALLRASSVKPSLILLDLGLPYMDGRQFREQQLLDPALASIPVIVVTADRSAHLGGTVVLRKPLRLNQLATEVERLLGRS